MGYKETVMSEEQIVEAIKEARKDTVKTYARYRAVSRKQAGITGSIAEKAGIQKVVDWVEKHRAINPDGTPYTEKALGGKELIQFRALTEDLQAFLKEVEK